MRMLDVINAAKQWRELAGLPPANGERAERRVRRKSRRDDTMRPAA